MKKRERTALYFIRIYGKKERCHDNMEKHHYNMQTDV